MVREVAPSTPFVWTYKGIDGQPSPAMTALRNADESLSAMADITGNANHAIKQSDRISSARRPR
jgi:hypothetical protein